MQPRRATATLCEERNDKDVSAPWRLVARGMTNNEIADTLFLRRRTVHAHFARNLHKLGVGHRSAATRHAIQHGLL